MRYRIGFKSISLQGLSLMKQGMESCTITYIQKMAAEHNLSFNTAYTIFTEMCMQYFQNQARIR